MDDNDADLQWQLDWGRGPFHVSRADEALRKRIVEDPYDDSLREVYAALTAERGNPRGEYIRLAMLAENADRGLKRRIDDAMTDLRARYGRAIYLEWFDSPFGRSLGRMLSSACGGERAGFLNHYAFESREHSDLDVLASLTPLESIAVKGPPPPLGRTRVRDLEYWSSHPKDLPNPRRVRPMGRRSPMPPMPTCEELYAHARGLAGRLEGMPELRVLHVGGIDEAALETIARLPKLERLVSSNGLPRGAGEVFRRQGSFPALQSLTIVETGVDLAAIGEFAHRRQLRELRLEVIADLAPLLSALSGAKLEVLGLYGVVDMGFPLKLAPFETLRLDQLHTLELAEYQAQPDVVALGQSPALENVDTLSLNGLEIDFDLLSRIAQTDLFEGVAELSLVCTNFDDARADALTQNPHFQKLERIRLSATGLGEAGARALLQRCTCLAEIDFGHCHGFQPLSWLSELPHLTSLRRIHGTRTGGQTKQALEALVSSPHARSLREVDLPDLREARDRNIDAFVESPHLVELGQIPVHAELDAEVMEKLLRRFGHRVGIFAGPRRGPLPDPDLDPWWQA